ncbi:phytoene desaturase family protein [Oscillospiraceae bacterium LTW-04]|nr:phytoene desaturase family protein [Oscillospiraceae bacterium MB24-C1]
MKKKVAIIGSGIGGLCTGIRLLNEGFDVDIYEKQKFAGGVTGTNPKGGFRFDTTASIALDPLEYDTVFKDCGLNPRQYFSFIDLDVLYTVFFEHGKTWQVNRSANTQKENFLNFFGEPFKNYATFTNKLYKKYLVADKFFLTQSFCDVKSIVNSQTLIAALKLKPYKSAYSEISNYVNNQNLRNFLAFLSFYMGISPYKLINIYASVPALTQVRGIKHIKGGMSQYTKALIMAFKDLGGRLFCDMPIKEIAIKDSMAYGVKTNEKFVPYDLVVSNVDYCYSISNLIKDETISKRYNPRVTKSVKTSCSVFILRLVLLKKLENFSVHNIYIGNDFKKEIDRIFSGLLPRNPPIYFYYPSSIDQSFVVNGSGSINIMVRVPNLKDDNPKWDNETIESLKNLLKSKLSEISGISDIENVIVYEDVFTPIDLQERYNCYLGAAFGLGHTILQSIFFRPQVYNRKVENLYFVGSSIHPGNGVTMVMKCAKTAAEKITKNTSN